MRSKSNTNRHGCNHNFSFTLKKVSTHTTDVADIITDIIGNNRGVAWIIFRNAGFDFADQISANVCCFGKDAAAEARKQGYQRSTQAITGDKLRVSKEDIQKRNTHQIKAYYG